MTVRKKCKGCDAAIPPQKGSARPRLYCVKCRPPRGRKNPRLIGVPAEEPSPPEEQPPAKGAQTVRPLAPGGGLVETYRERLETAKRVDTFEGQHVLMLARLLAEGAATGAHTAAGVTALSRELRAAMAEALKGAPAEPDLVDELQERRRQREAGL
jgi:hypothetical protein